MSMPSNRTIGRSYRKRLAGRDAYLASDGASQIARRHEQLDKSLSPVQPLGHANALRPIGQSLGDALDHVPAAAHDTGWPAAGSAGARGSRATSVRTVSD